MGNGSWAVSGSAEQLPEGQGGATVAGTSLPFPWLLWLLRSWIGPLLTWGMLCIPSCPTAPTAWDQSRMQPQGFTSILEHPGIASLTLPSRTLWSYRPTVPGRSHPL